jgi:FkbM family methyltransferase
MKTKLIDSNTPLLSTKDLVLMFYNNVLKNKPTHFCEIGAFKAEASVYMSKNLSSAKRIIAFEANPHNYNIFKKGIPSSIEYLNLAISDKKEEINFYLQNKGNYIVGNNSLLKRTNESIDYTPVTVQCDTLDNIVYDKNSTYALWIDAEGMGYEVLKGANLVLKNTINILIEVEEFNFWKNQKLADDTINLLLNAGFEVIARDQEYINQFNILFQKKNEY